MKYRQNQFKRNIIFNFFKILAFLFSPILIIVYVLAALIHAIIVPFMMYVEFGKFDFKKNLRWNKNQFISECWDLFTGWR